MWGELGWSPPHSWVGVGRRGGAEAMSVWPAGVGWGRAEWGGSAENRKAKFVIDNLKAIELKRADAPIVDS